MPLAPRPLKQYHVFLASPGDVQAERQYVRKFFDDYNRHTAHIWNARFEVIDWENYATTGVGRPQELITQQTLKTYRDSLALVVGIMGQRFGSPTGKAESGTVEEFHWAMESHKATGFPEIKWFFRKVDKLELPADPDEADKALDQWRKVRAFRQRMQDLNDPIFYTEYPGAASFAAVLRRWPRTGPTRRLALCSHSAPSRIRTLRSGVRLPARWAIHTPRLAASCRRETSMESRRISIRCNRFPAIISNKRPKEPASVPTTSTPRSRRSRPTWDGTSRAARSHQVRRRPEESVPGRGANAAHV
jgi:hypothetical protein